MRLAAPANMCQGSPRLARRIKPFRQDHDARQARCGTTDFHQLRSSCACHRPELLETFPNPYPDREYEIHMECHRIHLALSARGIETDAAELALLKGGAPDFGTIRITYVPGGVCIELKSLKLYLWSFRNDGIFYERAVNRILDDLAGKCQPRWMEVVGDFNVRGGIKSVITAIGGRSRRGQKPDAEARGKLALFWLQTSGFDLVRVGGSAFAVYVYAFRPGSSVGRAAD